MKKLIYVFSSASAQPGSVQKKVLNQIKALRLAGSDCKGLFFTTDSTDGLQTDEAEFIRVEKIAGGLFRSSRQRAEYHKAVYRYFTDNSPEFDLIFYRYPGAHRYLHLLMHLLNKKVFFEHLTAETREIKLYARENKLRLSISSLLSYYEFYFMPLFREWMYGKSIRKKAAFGICNSADIAAYEIRESGGSYKTLVLGDAVNTSEYKIKGIRIPDKELKLIFLKGAATEADFNGLDRLMKGMALYKGTLKLKLYLRGVNLKKEMELAKSLGVGEMIDWGGFISKEEADVLMEEMHLGVSALAVHRKGLKSTTTIKSREYFARGIPFIFGHHDPDFSGNDEARKYCLELPANEDPIDIYKVLEWLFSCVKIHEYNLAMRTYANNHLDYNVKMKMLCQYILNYCEKNYK